MGMNKESDNLGRDAAHRDRPGVGRGGEGAGRRRDPGSGRESETLPAVRAELRVLLGGPPAGGRAGRCSGRGYPVRRGRDLAELVLCAYFYTVLCIDEYYSLEIGRASCRERV